MRPAAALLGASAVLLGLAAVAVSDRNTLAGVVRAHVAAREAGMRLVVGARLDLVDAPSLLCLPSDRTASRSDIGPPSAMQRHTAASASDTTDPTSSGVSARSCGVTRSLKPGGRSSETASNSDEK